ncbi:MAG TPA: helix-turn-helix domain-containing protein [Candidatus Agathobaculum pullicola]|uniref:helix-turn-helix domain-containing protein n=1 Tax=Candidatus Agathobaculum pullicola TaxID=2838426 RepID=UPI001F97AFBA|nr:helix-turn-helix domain-containing protein [Candidatus Agathobaculum pullicola]
MKLRIKDIREDRDLSQEAVAQALHIPRSTYCNYETGRRNIPNDVLCILADFYNVSLDYLLGRSDDGTPFRK